MRPRLALNNSGYGGEMDAVFGSQFLQRSRARCVFAANRTYRFLCQLGQALILTSRNHFWSLVGPVFVSIMTVVGSGRARTSFFDHVSHVVFRCASEEMSGILAPGVVTAVADKHPWGNLTDPQFITEPVRCELLAEHHEATVPIVSGADGSICPIPTRVFTARSIDPGKKIVEAVRGYATAHHRGPFSMVAPRADSSLRLGISLPELYRI